jgi:hypothetical protein
LINAERAREAHVRHAVALGLGLLLVAQGAIAAAAPAREDSTPEEVTYGAGSVLGTLVYSPLKVSFCALGAIASGVTLPFAGRRTAERVVGTSCRGTWVISPNVLKGRERVEFLGALPTRPTTAGQPHRTAAKQ